MRKPVIDVAKEYSLVLEGGGAKGAYQIGAWKAMLEAGVKINAVAGTSVGALNAALICMGDVEKAEKVWSEISYSKVMEVDEQLMKALFEGTLEPVQVFKNTLKLLKDGGVNIAPLKQMIHENVNEQQIRSGSIAFYLLTFSLSDHRELDLDMKEVEEGLMEDLLMASCYLPLFKHQKLHGKTFIDGGMYNNVPMESVVKRKYQNIIQIRIFGIGREKKVRIPNDTVILTVEPRVNLGNILDFSPEKSKRNMTIGYFDAMRLIYGLAGKIYYLEQIKEEWYYINKLINMHTDVINMISEERKLSTDPHTARRRLMEEILPQAAAELRLPDDWDYVQLFTAMLEAAAKFLRVHKYQVYTVDELLGIVKERGKEKKNDKGLPMFVCIIINGL